MSRANIRVTRLRDLRKIITPSDLKGWSLSLPAILLFVVFVVGPGVTGVIMSLHEWNGYSASSLKFIGLDNYIELFSTDRFWNSLRITFTIAFLNLFVKTAFAFGLALLLSKKTAGMRAYRIAIFVPYVLSITAVALIWRFVYEPYRGLLNQLIRIVGANFGYGDFVYGWLGNSNTALISVMVTITWFLFGFHMILFLAGLSSIPKEYYDAAKLETNNWFATLRYVTIPMLREVFLIVFVTTMAGSFGHLFAIFILLTGGGPAGRTEHLGIYMVMEAFEGFRFGYASAISVVLVTIVILIVLYPVLRITRERLEF